MLRTDFITEKTHAVFLFGQKNKKRETFFCEIASLPQHSLLARFVLSSLFADNIFVVQKSSRSRPMQYIHIRTRDVNDNILWRKEKTRPRRRGEKEKLNFGGPMRNS